MNDAEIHKVMAPLETSATAITVADLDMPDAPLIFANRAFETMTGYSRSDVLGKNCRFLQSEETNQYTVARIRAAVESKDSCTECLVNTRVSGERFLNLLILEPIKASRRRQLVLGCQFDVTRMVEICSLEEHIINVNTIATHISDGVGYSWSTSFVAHQMSASAALIRAELYFQGEDWNEVLPIRMEDVLH